MRAAKWTVILLLTLAPFTTKPAWSESALSSLGYGLPQPNANTRAAGMGMVSLAVPDSLGLNLLSPASWGGLETARFGFGGNYSSMYLEDMFNSDVSEQADFTGVAMAVPVRGEWFVGLSISPYTRMNYEWEFDDSTSWTSTSVKQQGKGGISQGLVALSIPVRTGMRLGAAVRPIFGKVDQHWREKYPDIEANSAGISISDRLHGVGWALSWQWIKPQLWSVGLSLMGPTQVSVERQTVVLAAGWSLYDKKVELPEKYDLPWDCSFGAAHWLGRHLAGFEVQYQGWDATDSPRALTDRFTDAFRFGAGWEWSPEYRPLDPLWKVLTFRSGFYMQDHYVRSLSGHQARKIAFTGGFSIPYFKGRSRVDIALEVGWMGDRDSDGVAERSIGLNIGFNHSEKWFIGRRERN